MITRLMKFAVAMVCCFLGASALLAQEALPKEAASDPVLRAMVAEMERSKAQLKLDGVNAPYYIDYRNRRLDYLQAVVDHLVNWEYVAERFETGEA